MIHLVAASPRVRVAADDAGVPGAAEPGAELQALRVEVQRLRLALTLSRAREERNRHLALHDALTGLPNRREFDHQSVRAVARHDRGGHEFALLYLDLDGFKTINDQYGHDTGDELLKVIGARLAHAVRKGDSISRHGGDEFACLLPDVADDGQATSIARKLHFAISAPCQVGSVKVSIGPSIGMALYPRDASTVATLLEAADQAMRWAKQERLGLAFFSCMPRTVRLTSRPRAAGAARPNLLPGRAATAGRQPGAD